MTGFIIGMIMAILGATNPVEEVGVVMNLENKYVCETSAYIDVNGDRYWGNSIYGPNTLKWWTDADVLEIWVSF